MIKLTDYRAFYSSESRDEYNKGEKHHIYINPEHIVAIEKATVGREGIWPSAWDATRIYTLKGQWTVEGNVEAVREIIENATR